MGKDIINIKDTRSAMEFLTMFCRTKFCPEAYINKPEEAYIACSVGATLGLPAFTSMQNIAVINKRPCVWGDALKGIVLPYCTDFKEDFNEETFTATCTIFRRGYETPIIKTFSWTDAEQAQLTKKGVWALYPKRMLQMRARGLAIRDAFPDILCGLITREEAEDYPTVIDSSPALDFSDLQNAEIPAEEMKKITDKQEEKENKRQQKKTERLAAKLSSRPAATLITEPATLITEEPEYIAAQQEIITDNAEG